MSTPASGPLATRFWLPDAELATCLRAGAVRDTRALGELPLAQRFNRFPAHAYCGITWLLEGEAVLMRSGGQDVQQRLPRVFVSGPQRHPVESLNLTPIHSFFLVFHPTALARLFGFEPQAWRDQHVPIEQVSALAQALAPLTELVVTATDDEQRWQRSQDWLRARWCAVAPQDRLGPALAQGWLARLGVRAAAQALGWSMRQLQRQGQLLVGLRPAELKRLQRAEAAVREMLLSEQAEGWAAVASRHGFADQAHLAREVRAIAGASPEALRRAVQGEDPSWWAYRMEQQEGAGDAKGMSAGL